MSGVSIGVQLPIWYSNSELEVLNLITINRCFLYMKGLQASTDFLFNVFTLSKSFFTIYLLSFRSCNIAQRTVFAVVTSKWENTIFLEV